MNNNRAQSLHWRIIQLHEQDSRQFKKT